MALTILPDQRSNLSPVASRPLDPPYSAFFTPPEGARRDNGDNKRATRLAGREICNGEDRSESAYPTTAPGILVSERGKTMEDRAAVDRANDGSQDRESRFRLFPFRQSDYRDFFLRVNAKSG